jgi:hypothetical protein
MMNRHRALRMAVLLAAVALAASGCGPKSSATSPASGTTPVVVRILVDGVPRGVGASLAKGQSVRVRATGVTVGTIESVEVTALAQASPDSSGRLVASPSPVAEQILVTVRGAAVVSESGYTFGGGNLYVNDLQEFVTPTTILRGSIVSMQPGP